MAAFSICGWPLAAAALTHSELGRACRFAYFGLGDLPSMEASNAVPCESCSAPADLAVEMAPLGSEPGHRIYQCSFCKRFTGTNWTMPQRAAAVALQVQQ
jgi:hypothetical protein